VTYFQYGLQAINSCKTPEIFLSQLIVVHNKIASLDNPVVDTINIWDIFNTILFKIFQVEPRKVCDAILTILRRKKIDKFYMNNLFLFFVKNSKQMTFEEFSQLALSFYQNWGLSQGKSNLEVLVTRVGIELLTLVQKDSSLAGELLRFPNSFSKIDNPIPLLIWFFDQKLEINVEHIGRKYLMDVYELAKKRKLDSFAQSVLNRRRDY
jgi:hypothetical protein